MPEESFQDKTEPATPRKKEESRKKGQVAKSRELSSVAVLSAGVLYLYFGGMHMIEYLGMCIRSSFKTAYLCTDNIQDLISLAVSSVEKFTWIALPVMVVTMIIALAVNVLQTGFLFSVETLSPKASKINPLEGAKRIFSRQSLVELAKSILKLIIVGSVAFSTLKNELNHMIPLVYQEKNQIFAVLGQSAFKVTIRCCVILAVLAILDFLYQRWDHEQKLKMTKQEVKDEYKHTEGDPMVKSRIRSIQREMARRRMMEAVPKADVVITNPTHLAVALRYDQKNMPAPRIVAKGANMIAERIKNLAREHEIPIVEDKPLAQNLYKLEIGEEIPTQFYQAVAEILAYVYGLRRKQEQKI
jgi:flagellar biosynthetic protein FlhB